MSDMRVGNRKGVSEGDAIWCLEGMHIVLAPITKQLEILFEFPLAKGELDIRDTKIFSGDVIRAGQIICEHD